MRCWQCGKEDEESAMTAVALCGSPWDAPEKIWLHRDCEDAPGCYVEAAEEFGVCARCEHSILRSAASGMAYFRYFPEGEVCLACYEQQLYEKGHTKEELELCLPGMFFDRGTLEKRGYKELEHARFVKGPDASTALCQELLAMINDGFKVVVDYEILGQGGGEGYVNIWRK